VNEYEYDCMVYLTFWGKMIHVCLNECFEMKCAGQTQALKNEAERLKQMSGRHRRSRSVNSCLDPSPGGDASAINWQMLDMARLSLNGSPAHPRGGYGL
jgi:hypothetical protein